MLDIICGLPTRRYVNLRLGRPVARPIQSFRQRVAELKRLREQVRSAELRLNRSRALDVRLRTAALLDCKTGGPLSHREQFDEALDGVWWG